MVWFWSVPPFLYPPCQTQRAWWGACKLPGKIFLALLSQQIVPTPLVILSKRGPLCRLAGILQVAPAHISCVLPCSFCSAACQQNDKTCNQEGHRALSIPGRHLALTWPSPSQSNPNGLAGEPQHTGPEPRQCRFQSQLHLWLGPLGLGQCLARGRGGVT